MSEEAPLELSEEGMTETESTEIKKGFDGFLDAANLVQEMPPGPQREMVIEEIAKAGDAPKRMMRALGVDVSIVEASSDSRRDTTRNEPS